jgi:deoxyribonuclease V
MDATTWWQSSPKEAVALQRQLRQQIQLSSLNLHTVQYIAGADVSFDKGSNWVSAGLVLLDWATLQPVLVSLVQVEINFPYIPGLLSFREIPALWQAWEQLPVKPQLVMVDGHGIAHPRRLGIATHFGLLANCPTLGCAKKILVGQVDAELPEEQGAAVPLIHYQKKNNQQEQVAWVLRSRTGVQPVYVSPGHLLDLKSALAVGRHCLGRYKLLQPTQQAHWAVNLLRKGEADTGVTWL